MKRNTLTSRDPAMLALSETLDLLRILWSVYHGLQKTSKRMSVTIGLTGAERITIRLIGRFPGIAAGHLADLLHVHPSTLTGVLKALEKRRLLERLVDGGDGRRVLLRLTKAGNRFDIEQDGTAEAAVARAMRSHSPASVHAARQLLITVAAELDSPSRSRVNASARKNRSRSPQRGRARSSRSTSQPRYRPRNRSREDTPAR